MVRVFDLDEKLTAVVYISQALLYAKSPVTVLPKTTPRGYSVVGPEQLLDLELNIGILPDFCKNHRVLRQSESNLGGASG